MRRLRALRDLARCLRGEARPDCDWAAVLGLANQSLVTPQLAAAVLPCADVVPAPYVQFLDEVLRRNRERNLRLWRQLMEALAALNAAAITPVALKGAALWLWSGESRERLLSDLDLMVAPEEAERALAALVAAGFDIAKRQEGPLVHVVAELGRPQDVGLIDLHQRPPGPPGLLDAADAMGRCVEIEVEGARVRVPDPAAQILHLVLHDQFHDGDFWRGGFDLRHNLDLARLAPALTAEDWRWLDRACGTGLVRTALAAQLRAAEELAGSAVPRPRAQGAWTHRRWRLQFAHPSLRLPLAALAVAGHGLQVRAHRRTAHVLQRQAIPAPPPSASAREPRAQRLAHIMTVRSGKI